ncbi:hypothetical protein [Corynebacterium glucuronolyticum]|uniref:hypothetical protein n=1 Tax=Corynebacterium glucuronolyticum TaxID=39791 RepID=UPI00019C1F84|nr:hypothetical protein [Corynebacterium glucuronolyticum]EEI27655.1 hypothetical protein HMPREF0294_0799 [Corynebacterium glucuronolyticum ATCC 51867]MCT1443267.1 hypothetical protein [Corynebacterium glucuronolyticum]QQU88477.1 hypothetical protein I6I68_00245 [Corynebacterium glucuronolyticum]QRO82175.1 hypothetical protein I6J20_09960 [Corynebacterium glucuronolyticum]
MKRLIALAVAATATLTGCSVESTEQASREPATVTVTTSAQDKEEATLRRLRAATPAFQTTPENLRRECAFAMIDKLPSNYRDMDLPETLDFSDGGGTEGSSGEWKQAFMAGGNFRWVDTEGTWHENAYVCTVSAEDGAITETTAVVI